MVKQIFAPLSTRTIRTFWMTNWEISIFMAGVSNVVVPGQIFFFDPVILESIFYRTRAKKLINESNTTGWRKNWPGIQT